MPPAHSQATVKPPHPTRADATDTELVGTDHLSLGFRSSVPLGFRSKTAALANKILTYNRILVFYAGMFLYAVQPRADSWTNSREALPRHHQSKSVLSRSHDFPPPLWDARLSNTVLSLGLTRDYLHVMAFVCTAIMSLQAGTVTSLQPPPKFTSLTSTASQFTHVLFTISHHSYHNFPPWRMSKKRMMTIILYAL